MEGKWDHKSNVSVDGLFDLVSDTQVGTPHAYYDEKFPNAVVPESTIDLVACMRGGPYNSIGAHGDGNNIYGVDHETPVSRAQLRNLVQRATHEKGATLQGLYLGCCLFGDRRHAELMLSSARSAKSLTWVAGYTEEVECVDSSALDSSS